MDEIQAATSAAMALSGRQMPSNNRASAVKTSGNTLSDKLQFCSYNLNVFCFIDIKFLYLE